MKHIGTDPNAVTAYDDDKLQANIAMLGFKVAAANDLAKYNLQDQIIDEYEDATGIDASASTNERLVSGVYDGGTLTTSNPTGATSTDTSVTDKRIDVLSASTGTLTFAASGNVDILVVAGGGSGGCHYGGGGGAGGLIYKGSHAVTAQAYSWVVGAGGAAKTTVGNGNAGGDSTWTDASSSVEFTAKGGGGGGTQNYAGSGGGSGGGGGYESAGGAASQGGQSGDSGTYGFGYAGGVGSLNYNPGGGGGSGGIGQNAGSGGSGDGGIGKDYSAIFGTAVGDSGWFANGGGGGWSSIGLWDGLGLAMGNGGATDGGNNNNDGTASAAAQANTGGGSGGGGSGEYHSGTGGSGVILVRYDDDEFEITTSGADLTLQSTANTASSAATKADLIMLIENSSGTATINTDIKGYVTADGGSNWTEGTLVDEGSWGTNKKIYAFHDATVTSGTDMRYKITTHNQSSGSKETKIHATSLGWKA